MNSNNEASPLTKQITQKIGTVKENNRKNGIANTKAPVILLSNEWLDANLRNLIAAVEYAERRNNNIIDTQYHIDVGSIVHK